MGLHDGMLRSALHRLVLGKVSKCARNNLLLFLIAFPFRSYREELATELAASCQRQRHRGVLSDGRWEVGTRGIQGSFRTPPRDRAVGSTRCAPPLRWPGRQRTRCAYCRAFADVFIHSYSILYVYVHVIVITLTLKYVSS